MTESSNNHPEFHQILNRSEKERLLRQNARVIWFTGLSGAGKTTIAGRIEKELNQRGYLTQILDGDVVRSGINNNLGFSPDDRYENVRRIAEISKLFLHCGIICLNSFISPTHKIRQMAKDIIGQDDFIEVYINASLEVCEKRDTKGLYQKARAGKIKDFTGIDAPFEAPENPDVEINTEALSIDESVSMALEYILPVIEYKMP
ncbi:MAG: adenylyl-sulfate kinase [Bacteroidales bacterium]|nr:adenylyl-sulfate kinase [Bacteroidales bacterium]